MAKKKATTKTVVSLVLDETGSMYGIADDTRGAVNQYFEDVAKEHPEAFAYVSKFSTSGNEWYRTLCSNVQITAVPKLDNNNYRPNGNTPLYDAIGKAISDLESIEADRYLLVIMTDGFENASREYSRETIKNMIEEKNNTGTWTVVYLGANQDAWAVGSQLGVHSGSTMSYASTARGVHHTTSSLSTATSSMLSTKATATQDFFGDAGQTQEDYNDETETK